MAGGFISYNWNCSATTVCLGIQVCYTALDVASGSDYEWATDVWWISDYFICYTAGSILYATFIHKQTCKNKLKCKSWWNLRNLTSSPLVGCSSGNAAGCLLIRSIAGSSCPCAKIFWGEIWKLKFLPIHRSMLDKSAYRCTRWLAKWHL